MEFILARTIRHLPRKTLETEQQPVRFFLLFWAAAGAVTVALAGGERGAIYTIPAEEALNGPKQADPNYLFHAANGEPDILVDASKICGHVNPLTFGACFEDLDHEIYGGLYAQMIYGESFEEGPEKALPPGWRTIPRELRSPTWQGMWGSDGGALSMTGFRWYKLFWTNAAFSDGVIRCDMMQPAFDPGLGRQVGVRQGLVDSPAPRQWAG